VVFCDKLLHQQYSQIFHNRVKQVLVDTIEQSNGVVFVEIPLIDAFDFSWQQIWLVERDLQTRVDAVVKRAGVSAQNAMNIVSNQQIATNYTIKIDNNGTLDELFKQVDSLLQANNLL